MRADRVTCEAVLQECVFEDRLIGAHANRVVVPVIRGRACLPDLSITGALCLYTCNWATFPLPAMFKGNCCSYWCFDPTHAHVILRQLHMMLLHKLADQAVSNN